jgi:hypothetical protein
VKKKKPGNKESPLLPGLLYALLFLKQTKLRARHLYEFTIRDFTEKRLTPLVGLTLDRQPEIFHLLLPLNDTML